MFAFNIDPKTNINNIVYYKNYRISILKNNLIRIEKSIDKNFNDFPTQVALYRNFNQNHFETIEKNDELVILLKGYELHLNDDISSSFIIFKNKKIFLNNDENLGGTYSTVDEMDGEIYKGRKSEMPETRKIGLGICSRNGVAIVDDSASYCFDDNFNFSHQNKDEVDVYIFFYPNKYKEALKDFYLLSGFTPKLPKYVFGNWWSRFYAYTQKSYIYLMDNFIKEDIPFTIATVDMDWHYSMTNGRNLFDDLDMKEDDFILEKNEDKDHVYICDFWKDKTDPWSRGWTGLTFNKKLFPDYKKFLKDLNERNLKVTLNIHPRQGIAFYEEMYERCAEYMGLDASKKKNIPFDFTDAKNRDLYFTQVYNKYENDGVDFWWIDWQQGEESKLPGLTPLWMCNHYFYLDNAKNHNDRGVILSRFAGVGGHRYPLGFSGDTLQTFDSLKYLIKTTSMASNIGCSYWSHDIGGHMRGMKNGDLFLKFVQFAVFSPILRIHSACEETFSKEPDLYLKGNNEMIKKYLRLRHKMIPYIYSESLKNHKYGTALLEPIYYYYPNNQKAYEYKDTQYFFAKDILVAPFSNPKDKNDNNSIDVYFPKGNYYDLKYGYKYSGNKVKKIIREQGDMAVFIKEGAFFILDSNNHGNDIKNPSSIDVITTCGDGKYNFYEDNGNDKEIVTVFKHQKLSNGVGEIRVKIKGNNSVYQKDRVYNFKLLNVHNVNEINCDDSNISDVFVEGSCLEFKLTDVPFNKEVVIRYTFNELSDFEYLKRDITKRIMYIDDDNSLRSKMYYKLKTISNVKELIAAVKNSSLSHESQKKLLELIK